jgi:hypothetical protein
LSLSFPAVSVLAQDDSFVVTALGGYSYLGLEQVDEDNEADVLGYQELGYDVSVMESLKHMIVYGGKVTYFYQRDNFVSLMVLVGNKEVSTSGDDGQLALTLRRSVGFTDVFAGFGFHVAQLSPEGNLYGELQIGMLFGRAGSYAYETETVKVGNTSVTTVLDDSEGSFSKSKLAVAAGLIGSTPLFGPVVGSLELRYQVGNVGKMDGTLTTFGVSQPRTTSIDFNFSGLLATAGIGIQF